jgi:hypothetical protein
MKRALVGDTEDIRSSRDGSGCLGTDMLERLSSTSECATAVPSCQVTPQRTRVCTAYTHLLNHGLYTPSSLPSVFAHPIHQEPSLRLVPAKAPVKASISDTANSLGLHDTLKYGPRTLADEIKSTNPLQARLENVRHSMPCTITSAKQGTCYHSGMRLRGPSS